MCHNTTIYNIEDADHGPLGLDLSKHVLDTSVWGNCFIVYVEVTQMGAIDIYMSASRLPSILCVSFHICQTVCFYCPHLLYPHFATPECYVCNCYLTEPGNAAGCHLP